MTVYNSNSLNNKYNLFDQRQVNHNAQNRRVDNFVSNPNATQNKPLFAQFFDSIAQLDNITTNQDNNMPLNNAKSTSKPKKVSGNEAKQIASRIKNKINRLKAEAMQGKIEAFGKLEEMKMGKDIDFEKLSQSEECLDQNLMNEAASAVDSVVNSAPYNPPVLKMFMDALSNENKNTNKKSASDKAYYYLNDLINRGQLNIERDARPLMKKGGKKTIEALTILSQANIPEDARKDIAKLLSEHATTHGTSESGDLATKGLKKIIQKEGQNGVLDQAFDGLTNSAIMGNNNQSVSVLEKVANSNTSSFNKSFKAIDALTKIALHSSNSAIGDMAVMSLQKTALRQAGNS
ncbi:MAG: hypothetical protein AB1782_17170, partial [Cyanobacteriota bacterium]